MQQCERRAALLIGGRMMLEHSRHGASDNQRLLRVAHEVADDADIVGMGEFHERDDVGAVIVEGRVHGMPDSLVAVEKPGRFHGFVGEVERMAAMADPLGPPLESPAVLTGLEE